MNKAICPQIPEGELNFKIILLDNGANVKTWREAVRSAIKDGAERFLLVGRGVPTRRSEKSKGIVVVDQINVSGQNPLVGPNDEEFGTRFPDMTDLYSPKLTTDVLIASQKAGLVLQKGILLVPASMTSSTSLEEQLIAQNEIAALSQDVFAGAITVRHAGRQCAGIILFSDIDGEQLGQLLTRLDW
ncbi:MAG TPA: hypothetical protein PK464_00505 [Candidatus Marinimicrobia bacterium]|nr:hypothetical protein [Candidatus Neomarinimicrobiota bacterium]